MSSRILLSALALATISGIGCATPAPRDGMISCNPETFTLNDGQCPADWEECRLMGPDADDGLCFQEGGGEDAGLDAGTPTDIGPADVLMARTDADAAPIDAPTDSFSMSDAADCMGDSLIGTPCVTSTRECEVSIWRCVAGVRECTVELAPSTTVCRESDGACDMAETCTGTSPTCPVDALLPAGSECRAAMGACDVAEACSGSSAACPANGYLPAASACRPAAGECDVAESCSGSSGDCPADAFATTGRACSGGFCNPTGMCSDTCVPDIACSTGNPCQRGTVSCSTGTPVCVNRGAAPDTTLCRAAASGGCDVAEFCDGSTDTCPADLFAPSTTVCGDPVDGACDVADRCTGTNATCRSLVQAAGFVCNASVGACDAAEACTGTSTLCPPEQYQPAATVCRAAAAGGCDIAETCSGSSGLCPVDAFATSVCRPSAGACDVAESCSGSSAACPTDALAGPAVVCRSAAGVCDVAETCSGSAVSCPTNVLAPPGMVCRAAVADSCDVAEVCNGTSVTCAADGFAPSTTPCPTGCTLNCSGSSTSCAVLPTNTLYVSPTGVGDGLTPCNPTNMMGFETASAASLTGWTVRFAVGTYSRTATLMLMDPKFNGITLEGGYSADFRTRPGAIRGSSPRTLISVMTAREGVRIGQPMIINGIDITGCNDFSCAVSRSALCAISGRIG